MPVPTDSQPESEPGSCAAAGSPAGSPIGANSTQEVAYRDLIIPCVMVTWQGEAPVDGYERSDSVQALCSHGARLVALDLLGGEELMIEWACSAAFQAAMGDAQGSSDVTRSLARAEGPELEVRLIPRRDRRPDDASDVHRWLVEIVDETPHAERARAGAHANDVLERLIETMPMTLFTKDPKDNFRITRVNRSFEETFGMRREDVVGGFDSDLFDDDELNRKYREDDVAVFRDAQVRVIDEEIPTPIGRRQARTIKVPMFDEDGNPELLLGILQDVTDFRKALREAEQARRLKSQFLRGLGREIVTRLGVIVHELEESGDASATARTEARELLTCVLEGLELESNERRGDRRGASASDDSSSDPGARRYQLSEPDAAGTQTSLGTDPEKPLRDAFEDARAPASRRGIALELRSQIGASTNSHEDRPVVRFSEPDRVHEALRHLLSIAIQFSPRGSRVHVSVAIDAERRRLRYVVKDEGIGIPEEEQSFLFGSFRCTGFQSASQPRVGLGLTIVQKIVDLLGGSITVDSVLGAGSAFTIEIPCAITGAGPLEVSGGVPNLTPARILLADDNVAYQRIMRRRLEAAGHSVILADSGRDALATLRSRGAAIDFVIVDLQMGDVGGSGLLADLSAESGGHAIPIVALSSRGPEAEDLERDVCLQAGADAWLAKPLRGGELESTLAAIDRRSG